MSGISVSPTRQRLNLYFQLHLKNIQQLEVYWFLRELLRHLRGHVFVLWDGGRPHNGRLVKEYVRRVRRLHLVRFPGYAPELNPDEGVWKLAKQALANGCPPDRLELITSWSTPSIHPQEPQEPAHLHQPLRPAPLFALIAASSRQWSLNRLRSVPIDTRPGTFTSLLVDP